MAVTASYRSSLTVVETITGNPPLSSTDNTVTHSALDRSLTLNAGSTPDAELVAETAVELSSGAGEIDLTSITTSTGTVNATGKKVRAVKFRSPSSNQGGPITIECGTSNGYDMLGGSWSIPIPIDGEALLYLKDSAPAVGASAKTLKLSGTGTDTLYAIFVFG